MSSGVYNSRFVQFSSGVSSSQLVFHSYGIDRSFLVQSTYGAHNCLGVVKCEGVTNRIFSYGTKGSDGRYYIFDKPVTWSRFTEITMKSEKLFFKGLFPDFENYVKSLPEFDPKIWARVEESGIFKNSINLLIKTNE